MIIIATAVFGISGIVTLYILSSIIYDIYSHYKKK